jgi:nitrous oxidase accessory protein NosD
VRHGIAEGNTIEDCGSGISIGHRDTDNVMRGNTIRRCRTGLTYRDDPIRQAAHDNLIEDNLFEDIGAADAPGCGIDLAAPVSGNVLRRNRFRCTRPGLMQTGIRIGERVGSVALESNEFEGLAVDVEDLRAR